MNETAVQAAGQGGNSLGTLEKQQSFSETLEGHRKSLGPLSALGVRDQLVNIALWMTSQG